MDKLEKTVLKHVLKNTHDYGEANPGTVMGKVIGEFPDAKKDVRKTMALIKDKTREVKKLGREEIGKMMEEFEYLKKEEKEKALELPDAEKGKVVTRFPPEPAGHLHIGHAKAAWLNFESANAYDGRMILRFDDTNPEKEKQEYIRPIKDDLKWLGISWSDETYTSDNIPGIYSTVEKLILKEKAYVCTCSRDEISRGRTEGRPCACRGLSADENMKRWKMMLDGGFGQGEAVARYRGNLESENTVMRDPSLARIMTATHYRNKGRYRVWPSYDLAVVFMDNREKVTHSMRSKEYELRNELYHALFKDLGYSLVHLIEFSRLAIKNAPVSKRLLRPLIKEKKVSGWDDPRLPTLAGLRRRGILPEAIKKFVLSFGLSKVESEPGWEVLLSENRKLLDSGADHYFFVENPVKLKITGLKKRKAKIPLNPKDKKAGSREVEVDDEVYIPADDAKNLKKGEVVRLKDFCNVRIADRKTAEYAGDEIVPKKIQWVSTKEALQCEVLVPGDLLKNGKFNSGSMRTAKGYCEKDCKQIKEGDVVQFERFGFCRLDSGKEKLIFVYSC